MGEEIANSCFNDPDFEAFQEKLIQQTQQLGQWFEQKRFVDDQPHCGFELEAWLVDENLDPASQNQDFITAMADENITPELANFNVEFNFTPQALRGQGLWRIHEEMEQRWNAAVAQAADMGLQVVQIGILPTVRDIDLSPRNISGLHRYHALNEQVMKLRHGRPLELDIHGKEILRTTQQDVMLESATTSFQIHFQIPLGLSRRVYNASIIASAPMVAISANSPYLFGKSLWAETRIPVFEQSVQVGGYEDGAHGPMRRVTFGSGYCRDSLFELFQENLEHYPVLLPTTLDEKTLFNYVRLHNGTLWRWNRPLIGHVGDDYHVRIEHRVVPAGPSIIDAMANAALYYGMVYSLANAEVAPEHDISFALARDNFYAAAQRGLDCQLIWRGNKKWGIQALTLKELLPLAWDGLSKLGVDSRCIKQYLGIIEQRVENHCNGSAWQQAFVSKYGNDMRQLTKAYLERQNSGVPVHEWSL